MQAQHIEIVEQIIIKPMIKTFTPPNHLKGDSEAFSYALNSYRDALVSYSENTLKRAYNQVTSNRRTWVWPTAGEFREVCEALSSRSENVGYVNSNATENDDYEHPWVKRRKTIEEKTQEYMSRVNDSHPFLEQATNEGWLQFMTRFLDMAARVQASFMVGEPNVGYEAHLFVPSDASEKVRYAIIKDFIATCKNQAQSGQIKVSITRELIERWKRKAELTRQFPFHGINLFS